MEVVVRPAALPAATFWRGRRVFLTGHTGFKGGWLSLWLNQLGAEVCGYALPPSTSPSFFEAAGVADVVQSTFGDIRDVEAMRRVFDAFEPTDLIHMAAQPLVRQSYLDPLETYSTNVMGVVNVLELARSRKAVSSTVIVTTDKCYENREQIWPYRETDRLGGRDPYSNSKACAEMATSAYWWSYFAGSESQGLASVRAGNVIGGGDWSKDRLVPDLIKAFEEDRAAILRRPEGVRPWQHVLEPLCGYLLAAEHVAGRLGSTALPSWNFGPGSEGNVPVATVADQLAKAWGGTARTAVVREANAPHEATLLTLDSTKAEKELGWRARWPLTTALQQTANWYRAFYEGRDVRAATLEQINHYTNA